METTWCALNIYIFMTLVCEQNILHCLPGADIADFFNYGFTEETWKLYCDKQRKMKGEINQLNKIAVSTSQTIGWGSSSLWYSISNNNVLVTFHSILRILSHTVRIFLLMLLLIIDDCKVDCVTCLFAGVCSINYSILLFNTHMIHLVCRANAFLFIKEMPFSIMVFHKFYWQIISYFHSLRTVTKFGDY